jgi:hypothetical protein
MAQEDQNKKKSAQRAKKPATKQKPATKPRAKKSTTRTKPDTVKKEQQRTTVAKQAMIEALTNALGVVTTASRIADVSTTQHYQWMQDDPEYRKQVEQVAEVAKDFVESQLFQQIKDGSTTATIFFMKCKMRERGYIEKQDVDLNLNRPDLSDLSTDEIKQHLKHGKK